MKAERDGERSELHLHNAFAQWGDMQIELMQPARDDRGFTGEMARGAMTNLHVAVFADVPEALVDAFRKGEMPLDWIVSPLGTDLQAYLIDGRPAWDIASRSTHRAPW